MSSGVRVSAITLLIYALFAAQTLKTTAQSNTKASIIFWLVWTPQKYKWSELMYEIYLLSNTFDNNANSIFY